MTTPVDQAYLNQNKGPWLYAIFCSLLGLSTIVAGLRLYCRVRYLKSLQWSDYLVVTAVITNYAMSTMIHMQIQTGMGRHIEYSEEHPGMLEESMKVGYAENILYQVTLGIAKSAILAQYYFIAGSCAQRRTVITILVFVVVFCLFVTLSAVFQCIPISAIFNPDTFPEGCWNMMAMNLATSSVNIVVDVVIFILPLPILAKLHMKRRKKFILLATYFFGSLSIAASALRISSMVLWTGETDFTYVSAIIPIYDAVEINTGLICACVPLLRPLIRAVTKSGMYASASRSAWVRTQSIPEGVGDTIQLKAPQTTFGDDTASHTTTISYV